VTGRPLIEFLPDEWEATMAERPTKVVSKHARPGRKPLEGGRVTAAFVLRRDQADWLEREALAKGVSKSELLRAIVDEIRSASPSD
jgi:hypothetical protein